MTWINPSFFTPYNDNYQNKIVEGIYNGIKEYFEQTENADTNINGNNV